MAIEIPTKDDLKHFKEVLLTELRQVVQSSAEDPREKWIKSEDVIRLLRIELATYEPHLNPKLLLNQPNHLNQPFNYPPMHLINIFNFQTSTPQDLEDYLLPVNDRRNKQPQNTNYKLQATSPHCTLRIGRPPQSGLR